MKRLVKGFTLVELVIVVAILGILALFALPAYQTFTKRAHLAEGLHLATAAKLAMTDHYAVHGFLWKKTYGLLDINAAYGLPDPEEIRGNAVSEVRINATVFNQILILYNHKVHNGSMTPVLTLQMITPSDRGGNPEWYCYIDGRYYLKEKWLPPSCYAHIGKIEEALKADGRDPNLIYNPPNGKEYKP